MVRDGIGELLDYARPAGMPLAIEPLHPMYAADRACVNTLAQANDAVRRAGGRRGLGIAVDVYHVWWDPRAASARSSAPASGAPRCSRITSATGWCRPPTCCNDRGMMGDGVIDLPLLRSWMEAAGYRGMHEVEIFSANNWWKRDPDEVLATCKARHRDCT